MNISKTMQDAINEQIKNEFYSAYLYLSMAAHFETTNLPGFANWMQIQTGEEKDHAMRFFQYVIDRGGKVELKAIDQPPLSWKTPREAFEQVLEHEQQVTSMINNLYALAMKENDYTSQVMLQWFLNEQVEEEKSASLILEQIKLIDARGTALYVLDHQLSKRSGD
jgi:ferritin